MNKKLLISGGIIIILALGIGVFLKFFNKKIVTTNIIVKKERDAVIYGSFVSPNDYIESIENGTLEDNNLVLIDEYPTKTIKIGYLDNNKDKKSITVDLEVIDIEKPLIMNAHNITINVGENPDFKHNVMIGDNVDRNPKIEIIGEYNINQIGTYQLKYLATDEAGNNTEQSFKLNVIRKSNNTSNQTNSSHNNYYFSDFINDYKNDSVKLGIDVSKWQGNINWQKVKDSGCEFAIIRVGYQYGKDGELKIDPYFEQNIQNANNVGIPIGIYFYSYAYSKEEAINQAKWIVEKIKNYKIDLPIAFDWENWTSFSTYGINFLDINQTAQSFIETINNSGYTGMMYSSKSYLDAIWNDYETVWLAHYTKKTDYSGNYLIWQASNIGKIDGINADVDLDVLYN